MPTALLDPVLPVVDCARVPIVACTREEAAREVVRLASSELASGIDIHLCNAYTVALADEDPGLLGLLQDSGLNFPDGKSVVWANRLRYRGRGLTSERVYGPDLMLDVIDQGRGVGLRHYLLGSTPEVLDDLGAALTERFPGVLIVGAESPPFRALSDGERSDQARRIERTEAQVVWVGLGTPKQDHEVSALAEEVAAVHVAVGAAFDFISGNKAQAPLWMQRNGLEWVHRLAQEPRRLWRRYFVGNAAFVRAAMRGR